MKKLLSILSEQKISLNYCYNSYEVRNDFLIIKKSSDYFSSIIELRELVDIFQGFKEEKDVDIYLLINGDISIKRLD